MFYGGVAALSLMACCYLLFRQSNAFAPSITTPKRLRWWTAAFFASMTACHLWYLPTYFLTASDDVMMGHHVCGLLDSLTVIPLPIIILIVMLQDHKRPLWPVAVMVAPLVVGKAWSIASRSDALDPILYAYGLLMYTGITIYMFHAQRQYRRWLRDNYADLEHKELWLSLVVLLIILLTIAIYALETNGLAYEYAMETSDIVLICYLLWRVETLSDLTIPARQAEEIVVSEHAEDDNHSLSIRNKIGQLLKQHCEETKFYLQYDISVTELARQIGTNRVYLSQHFAMKGTTYNAYINRLRIQHFINLYHEASTTHQPVTVQQLAYKSGFRSYGTFNSAFKQSMGMTATKWMRTYPHK